MCRLGLRYVFFVIFNFFSFVNLIFDFSSLPPHSTHPTRPMRPTTTNKHEQGPKRRGTRVVSAPRYFFLFLFSLLTLIYIFLYILPHLSPAPTFGPLRPPLLTPCHAFLSTHPPFQHPGRFPAP